MDEIAPKTARARGIGILKVYGVIYAVLIVLYVVNAFSGSVESTIGALKPGDRLWEGVVFEHKGAKAVLEAGAAVNTLMVDNLRMADKPDTKVLLHKPGLLYNLNWQYVLTLYNVIGMFLAFYTVGGDPVPAALDAESRRIAGELEAARTAKAEAARLEERRAEMMRELEAEKVRLADLAKDEAVRERARIIEEARVDADRLVETVKHRMESEVAEASKRLAREVARQAMALTREEFAGSSVTDEERLAMFKRFIRRIEETTVA